MSFVIQTVQRKLSSIYTENETLWYIHLIDELRYDGWSEADLAKIDWHSWYDAYFLKGYSPDEVSLLEHETLQ